MAIGVTPDELTRASELGMELTEALRRIVHERRPSASVLFTGLLSLAACQALRAGWTADRFAERARAVFVHITRSVVS